jgi:hypothetical protein
MHVSSKDTESAGRPQRPATAASAEVRPLRAIDRPELYRSSVALVARFVGALSLFAVGAVHLYEYDYLYSTIPTIGTLFVLNFAGATAIGLGLLAPVERVLGRLGSAVMGFLALGGIGLAATAFVFLLVAERAPVFGFMEPGYDPPGLMASRVSELVTVGLLSCFLVARFAGRGSAGRW